MGLNDWIIVLFSRTDDTIFSFMTYRVRIITIHKHESKRGSINAYPTLWKKKKKREHNFFISEQNEMHPSSTLFLLYTKNSLLLQSIIRAVKCYTQTYALWHGKFNSSFLIIYIITTLSTPFSSTRTKKIKLNVNLFIFNF